MTPRPTRRPIPTVRRVRPGELVLDLTIEADPDAPASAREALRELEPELTLDGMTSLGLVVSELVTNAIRHADAAENAQIELRVALSPTLARVEVTDAGHGFEAKIGPTTEGALGGWGLYLVDQIARRWWVEGGKTTRVVCELAREPAA